MLKVRQINNETVENLFKSAFREFVGRGQEYTYAEFSACTGIEQRTVESYARGETLPSVTNLVKIITVLGAPFVNRFLSPYGVVGARNAEGSGVDPTDMINALCSLIPLLSNINHTTIPDIDHKVDEVLEKLTAYKAER